MLNINYNHWSKKKILKNLILLASLVWTLTNLFIQWSWWQVNSQCVCKLIQISLFYLHDLKEKSYLEFRLLVYGKQYLFWIIHAMYCCCTMHCNACTLHDSHDQMVALISWQFRNIMCTIYLLVRSFARKFQIPKPNNWTNLIKWLLPKNMKFSIYYNPQVV